MSAPSSSVVVARVVSSAVDDAFEAFFSHTTALRSMDRDAVVEAAVALLGVGTLAVIIIWIGTTYTDGSLTDEGGFALVAAIAFFIVFMSAIGVGLSRRY